MMYSVIDLSSSRMEIIINHVPLAGVQISLKCASLDSKVLKLAVMVFNVDRLFSKSCFSLVAEERSFLRLSIFFCSLSGEGNLVMPSSCNCCFKESCSLYSDW